MSHKEVTGAAQQFAFRAPPQLRRRVDNLAMALPRTDGMPSSRSYIIRRALMIGVARLEKEALRSDMDEVSS